MLPPSCPGSNQSNPANLGNTKSVLPLKSLTVVEIKRCTSLFDYVVNLESPSA